MPGHDLDRDTVSALARRVGVGWPVLLRPVAREAHARVTDPSGWSAWQSSGGRARLATGPVGWPGRDLHGDLTRAETA